MKYSTGRLRQRAALLATTLVGVAALVGSSPASAQQSSYEFRIESTGSVVATATARGETFQLPTNTPHPYGAEVGTQLVMDGVGTCRITVDGAVVSEHPGPVAHCQYP